MENTLHPAAGRALDGFLKSGRFPHAVLIESAHPDQTDALIRQIAMTLLCRTPQSGQPCGQCTGCKKVEAGIHPDLLRYTGEGKSRAISVEQVREIRAQAYVLPNESEKKILVLGDAHNMLLPAQNALLKILEEPPASAVFILSADNRFRLLETVRSRVSIISLESGQGARETPENSIHKEAVAQMIEHMSRGEEAQVLACLSRYEKDRPGFIQMLNELRDSLLRDMISGGYKGPGSPTDPLRLWAFAAIIEETLGDAQHNVGVPLLSCALCAGFFEVSDDIL